MEGMTAKEVNSAMKKNTQKKNHAISFPHSTCIQQNIRKESRFDVLIWYQRPLFTVTITTAVEAVGCKVCIDSQVYACVPYFNQN